MMGYLSVTSMLGGRNLMMYVPICLFGYLTVGKIVANPEHVSGLAKTFISLSLVKKAFNKAITGAADLNTLQYDIMVYIGFYLPVVWFLGWANFVGIMLYWQVLRVSHMLNNETKKAFIRFD